MQQKQSVGEGVQSVIEYEYETAWQESTRNEMSHHGGGLERKQTKVNRSLRQRKFETIYAYKTFTRDASGYVGHLKSLCTWGVHILRNAIEVGE